MTGLSTHWFRKAMGLTQKEFAEMFDVSIATVKNWDTRLNMPKYIDKMLFTIVIQKDELKLWKG